MTRNPDATVYVYRHRETGTITALYSDDACAMSYRPDYEHVASLEPRAWIEHHFDDAVKKRKACAKFGTRQPMIKLNTDKSAAVNQSLTWLSIDDHPPPVGAKLLLINRANGVAVLGTYQAKHQWTHWQGLPKFKEEDK